MFERRGARGASILRTVVVVAGALATLLGVLGVNVRELLRNPRARQPQGE